METTSTSLRGTKVAISYSVALHVAEAAELLHLSVLKCIVLTLPDAPSHFDDCVILWSLRLAVRAMQELKAAGSPAAELLGRVLDISLEARADGQPFHPWAASPSKWHHPHRKIISSPTACCGSQSGSPPTKSTCSPLSVAVPKPPPQCPPSPPPLEANPRASKSSVGTVAFGGFFFVTLYTTPCPCSGALPSRCLRLHHARPPFFLPRGVLRLGEGGGRAHARGALLKASGGRGSLCVR